MANETYIDWGAQREVWAKRETTFGSDPTPSASNVVFVKDMTVRFSEEPLERLGASPQGPGFRPAVGSNYFEFSFGTELDLVTIAAGDSTDRPNCDFALYGGGWVESADSTDKTHTYVLGTHTEQGVTLYVTDFNSAGDNGRRTKLIGSQWGTRISWEAGQIVMIECDGAAKGAATPSTVIANLGSGPAAVTYPTTSPVVAVGAVLRLQNLADNSVYGGGTLASPTNGLALTSFSFDSGVSAVPQKGANATGGVTRIRAVRTAAPTLELSVEVTDLDEFDPYELKHDVQPLGVMVDFVQGSNKVRFYCNAVISDVEEDLSLIHI